MSAVNAKKPNLFSAIAIGVSGIIGSGWLFACYTAAQYAGPASILSWLIGALITLLPALLLAEIASCFPDERAISARLLTLTHNKDIGFLITLPNWFYITLFIAAEATASVQYLSQAYAPISQYIYVSSHFTASGIVLVCIFMILYLCVNYWGIKILSRVNSFIALIKIFVPLLTTAMLLYTSYHPSNFIIYHNTIAPYGYTKIFSAVVSCGIFFSFYGFGPIVLFSRELKNPQRNIPLAIISSILICTVIYIALQFAFIVSLDPAIIVKNGWSALHFESPLAELSILLGMNWLAILLYVDSGISPSGAGIIYLASSARIITGMAKDKQMPKVFSNEHHQHQISRWALLFALIFCACLVIFFDNWTKMMIIVSVFTCLSCAAIPIAYHRLQINDPITPRAFKVTLGTSISYIIFIIISYLLVQCKLVPLIVSDLFISIFFIIYCYTYYKSLLLSWRAFLSAWTMFIYLFILTTLAYIVEKELIPQGSIIIILISLISINYWLLVNQKNHNISRLNVLVATN